MITREQLEEGLENKNPFQDKNIDHNFIVVKLLRQRLPFDTCPTVIVGAGHDIVYFPSVDKICPHLEEDDIRILAECNVMIDEDNLAMFV